MKKKKTNHVKKKSLGLRIFIVIIAVAMIVGIIIMPLDPSAADEDSIVVESFETGSLAAALSEAADGTDYNFIKNVAVLSGCLNANDYNALLSIPNIENLELAGCDTENGIIPENAIPSRNQLKMITLPKNTEVIGAKAFSNNKKLEKVSMPSSVTKIADGAFEWCEALNSIPVSENITYIGEGAFRDCKAITEFILPSGVTEIYSYTFSKCGFLKFSIGPNVTAIGEGAFSDCNNLKDIYVYGENAPSLAGQSVFQNVSASIHVFEDSMKSYKSWEGNNLITDGDLSGEYTLKAVVPEENNTVYEEITVVSEKTTDEALISEINAETTVSSEESATEISKGITSAKTSEQVALEVSSEAKKGFSAAQLLITGVICAAAGVGAALVIVKLLKNKKA